MNDSKHPKRRRRSALADHDDQSEDLPRSARPVEEHSEPGSYDPEIKAQEEPHKNKKKNLYRDSRAIAERYGPFIGFDAFYCAVNEFQPRREHFDELGGLTIEGARTLTEIMGEVIATYNDYSCRVWQGMTKAELNVLREVQGLPPV